MRRLLILSLLLLTLAACDAGDSGLTINGLALLDTLPDAESRALTEAQIRNYAATEGFGTATVHTIEVSNNIPGFYPEPRPDTFPVEVWCVALTFEQQVFPMLIQRDTLDDDWGAFYSVPQLFGEGGCTVPTP